MFQCSIQPGLGSSANVLTSRPLTVPFTGSETIREFTVSNVLRNISGTEFTCTDNVLEEKFTLIVNCECYSVQVS